eukprot:152281_1
MGGVEINIWNIIQSGLTAVFLALYPLTVCLLYQIQHEMASNPWRFQLRKITVITCLILQLVIFTFLRDQYIWNEQVHEEDEVPNPLLCKLSRFLYYGIIEITTYYLIIMIIWDETEAQDICKHQLNPTIIQNIKTKVEDKKFYFSTVFKMYTFIISLITLIPSSVMPDSISNQFVDGIDSNYRCEISNIANIISIINKIIFLCFIIHSLIQLRTIETIHHKTNTISFIIIPICILLNIFVTINEFLLNILSFDNSRKIGFISTILLTIAMTCNHIMMQSQAKQKIISGARRVSTLLVQAGNSARQSLMKMNESFLLPFNQNKIAVDSPIAEGSKESSVASHVQQPNRFSLVEITEDEYDSVMIKQDESENVTILQKHDIKDDIIHTNTNNTNENNKTPENIDINTLDHDNTNANETHSEHIDTTTTDENENIDIDRD